MIGGDILNYSKKNKTLAEVEADCIFVGNNCKGITERGNYYTLKSFDNSESQLESGVNSYYPKGKSVITGHDCYGHDITSRIVSRFNYEVECRNFCNSVAGCVGAVLDKILVNSGRNPICWAKYVLIATNSADTAILFI
jgi:hypothetical protein